jgi:hypothetical protein
MRAGRQRTLIGREDSGGTVDPLLVLLIVALARAAARRDHAATISARTDSRDAPRSDLRPLLDRSAE